MAKYSCIKEKDEIHVFGQNQCFDKEDIKSLWEECGILYQSGGVMALWIEKRENMNPIIHLMGEDDGHIFWYKNNDICFDSYWLDNYIETLTEMKTKHIK